MGFGFSGLFAISIVGDITCEAVPYNYTTLFALIGLNIGITKLL